MRWCQLTADTADQHALQAPRCLHTSCAPCHARLQVATVSSDSLHIGAVQRACQREETDCSAMAAPLPCR